MATASREKILQELRRALPESVLLPELPASGPWQTFADPAQQFSTVLASVGGEYVTVASTAAADQALNDVSAWSEGQVRCSLVSGVGEQQSTLDVSTVNDPHQLEHVDCAVLPAYFAVAENGAVWVTSSDVCQRVLYFLPQHLVLVIPAGEIVHNMHEAYARIEPQRHTFSGFISGPSKTADIEQSLVIGAHGARSLTILGVKQLEAGSGTQ